MNAKSFRMLGVVLTIILTLVACGQPTPPATSETGSQNQASPSAAATSAASAAPSATETGATMAAGSVKLADGKLVLGVINDQSGVYADLSGKNSVEAVKMAVEDFKAKYGENALGGSIEVISADHQNKPDLANTRAREMYERSSADVILDVPTSSAALAVANVSKEQKKIFMAITAATTELTNAQCNKYTFHYAYDTYMLANGTGSVVTSEVGKNWYIIYPDYAFGQDMQKSFTKAIEASGGKVIQSDATPFPNDDFSTFLLKAPSLGTKPEILGTMQAGGDLVNVVKQYNSFGLREQGITLAVGLMFITDIHALGPDAFQGTNYTDAWYWNMDQEARAWADRFKDRTNTRPSFAHAGNYSAAMQYLEAVRRAGSDEADAVVSALEGYEFNDFFARNAKIRKEDHRVIHDAYLAQVKPSSEVKEEWDYVKILKTIPAQQAFAPVEQTTCKMQ
jgi:branched-chain amino acid transport system substrate-binding protein